MLSNQNRRDNRLLIILAFACIYIIWGSTYLAIRYAVETIPPLFVASFRHLIAGALLFAWCWRRGLRPVRQQWRASFVLAVLFFLIGHGTLHWAQQALPSGMAANLVATEPIFVAIIVMVTGRTRITPSLLLGVLLGVGGVTLIFGADVRTGRSEMLSSLVVLIGAASWSTGMVYSRSAALHPDSRMAAAMSLLAGAVLLFLGGTVTGELARLHFTAISMKSMLALVYLAVAGCRLAKRKPPRSMSSAKRLLRKGEPLENKSHPTEVGGLVQFLSTRSLAAGFAARCEAGLRPAGQPLFKDRAMPAVRAWPPSFRAEGRTRGIAPDF